MDDIRELTTASIRFLRTVDALRTRLAAARDVSTVEIRAISLISEGPAVTPKALSAGLEMTTGAVTALLDRLEGQGFLHRLPHPTDRRSSVLELTEQGRDVAGGTMDVYERVMACVVSGWDAETRKLLVDFFGETSDRLAEAAVTP